MFKDDPLALKCVIVYVTSPYLVMINIVCRKIEWNRFIFQKPIFGKNEFDNDYDFRQQYFSTEN